MSKKKKSVKRKWLTGKEMKRGLEDGSITIKTIRKQQELIGRELDRLLSGKQK